MTEIANVRAYIATGRRVVMIGGTFGSWGLWNSSLLATVGGTYFGSDTGNRLIPVIDHPLTAGVTFLDNYRGGIAIGGTSLFSENVITLWSGAGNSNVVTVLSNSIFGGGGQFDTNLANWLAVSTAIPEPSTFVLLGMAVILLLARAWLRRCVGRPKGSIHRPSFYPMVLPCPQLRPYLR